MMRENNDSEKKNLLPNCREQNEDKKRKQYNARNKSDRRSNGSVSSEQADTRAPGRLQESIYSKPKNRQPCPEADEETCSCASCALRRIVSSEYAYIICLLIIFIISIVAACILVFKNVPIVATQPTEKPEFFEIEDSKSADSERLKRKIDIPSDNGEKKELGEGGFGKLQYDMFGHDSLNLPVSRDIDFGPSFRELSGIEDEDSKSEDDMELANFLEPEKLEANDKLREFYKKLVQTDAKIKKLKKSSATESNFNINYNYETKSPDRFRRSLIYNYPKKYHVRRRRGLYDKGTGNDNKRRIIKRSKRFDNATGNNPTAFVIENKKLIVQYQPAAKKKVPKCSHNPKESNQNEKELKHPFYQNSQRLDELLDKFLNKNLPEIITHPFGLEILFEGRKNKCKHPKFNDNMHINIDMHQKNTDKTKDKTKTTDAVGKEPKKEDKSIIGNKNKVPKYINLVETVDQKAVTVYTPSDTLNLMSASPTTNYEQKFYNDESNLMANEKHNVVTASTTDFQVLLSASTLMNNEYGRSSNWVTRAPLINRVPNIRRLMQADEKEENLGYEDFKEVLTDNMENQDDVDRRADRKKREEEKDNKVTVATLHDEALQHAAQMEIPKVVRYNPPGVHNPNWKGHMPLYPDELNSMVQHGAMDVNKLDKLPPANDLDIEVKSEIRKKKASDVDYIEDYLDNRYDKLVEMAQAYSDYGVLKGKKENPRNDKNQATENISPGVRVKLSASGNFLSRGLLERMKDATTTPVGLSLKDNLSNLVNEQNAAISRTPYNTDQSSEGFRIELRPTTAIRDDVPEITKILQSHFQINPGKKAYKALRPPHTTELNFNSKGYPNLIEQSHKTMQPPKDNNDYMSDGLIFTIHKIRALHSKENKKLGGFFDYKILDDSKINDRATTSTTQIYNDNNQDDEVIVYEILDYMAAKQVPKIYPNHKDNLIISPDLSDFVLKKYNKIQSFNNVTQKAKNQMPLNNIPNGHRATSVKNVSGKYDSGTTLFKTASKVNQIQDTNLKTKLKSYKLSSLPYFFNFNNMKYNSSQFSSYDTNNETFIKNYDHTESLISIQKNNANNRISLRSKRQVNKRNKKNTSDVESNAAIPKENSELMNSKKIARAAKTINEIVNTSMSDTNAITSRNNACNNMTVSLFFSMISNWFHGRNKNIIETSTVPNSMNLVINLANYTNKSKTDKIKSTDTAKSHDSVKRYIVHKSRVLMSINDDNATDSEGKSVKEYIDVTEMKSMNVSESNKTATIATNMMMKNETSMAFKFGHTAVTNLPKKRRFGRKVKRNADNANLIFWNDIYDDEYGIQTNNMENVNIGDNSRNRNDFIKRSGRWVQEKFKKIADNLKNHDQEVDTRKRIPRDAVKNIGLIRYPKYIFNKILKRDSTVEKNYDSDHKAMFSAMRANLALVCQKAANAVQQVRNIEVKEDSKQGTIATSLMQQLVGLLTEIVDYQVQQKTCTKLPPDLQKYLEWLTLPEYDSKNVNMPESEPPTLKTTQTYSTTPLDIGEQKIASEPSQFSETPLPYEKVHEQRSSFLDTLRSIEDLMEEYKMMNDEDKSKMTGVKYYLENQMNYLKNEIGLPSLYNFGIDNLYFRYKRNHPSKVQGRRKRKLNKFIRNFGKKYTRTTAGYNDGATITEMKKIQDERLDTLERKHRLKKMHESMSKNVKRNLKDVYYHAIAEAKKYTKEGLKTRNTADFSTTHSIKLHGYNQDIIPMVKEKSNHDRSHINQQPKK